VRVGTPLGEYPFEFRRLERRGRGVAVVGNLAGLESSVVLGPEDVRALLRRSVLPLAAAALLLAYARSR
jgi:chorismate-pyruvate lyase